MAAKFEIDFQEALRQLAAFQLGSTNLGKHLDSLNTTMGKSGTAAQRLLSDMNSYYGKLQTQFTALNSDTKKSAEGIDAAFVKIRQSASKTFESVAQANVKANLAAAAYKGELMEVQKVLINTAQNNIYVKSMERQATLQAQLTANNVLMKASIEALSTTEGKLAVQLKERMASESRMAASNTKQIQNAKELQNQLDLLATSTGRANSEQQARIAVLAREQQEDIKLTAKLGELRRAYESLNGGIQQQIAAQQQMNNGLTQAATFRSREINQLSELQRAQASLNGGTAEQIAILKTQNQARTQEVTLLARQIAQMDSMRASLASLNGGQQESIVRLNEQIKARTAAIAAEERYTASIQQLSMVQARIQAQDEARSATMNAKNTATLAAARAQNALTEADAKQIALAEKITADTTQRNAKLIEAARAVHGLSAAQKELNTVQEREQATLAKLVAQRDGLSSAYGRNLAQVRAQITAQEQLNKLSTMSTAQLLGLTGAHERHSAAMNVGSQSAASLRAALSGLNANIGMYTSGTIVAASSTYALFNAMRSTVSLGADFTASMAQANAVMNSNNPWWMSGSIDAMETQVRALGQTTVFTASEVAKGLIDLGQAGLSSSEAILALRPALDLAQIGNVSMSQSADMATNVMMTFGKTATDLTNIVDIMATAAVDSNTNVLELANALTYAGPAAHAAGISLEETTAAIETLSNAGIKGSRAGTALRKLFTSLLNPTKKGAAVLDEYSIATQNADGSTRGLVDIVKDLNTALNTAGVSEGKRLSDIQNLVGLYATSPVAALVANASNLEAALFTLEHNVAGAAERMRNKMSDTLQVDWKTTMSAYEELQLQVYDKFEATLRLTSAKITKTLLDLTQPVKVLLNTDASAVDTQGLVDLANTNKPGSYKTSTNASGQVEALNAMTGQKVGADELVASMDQLSQSSLTVVTQLDVLIEKFKTFGEAAMYIIGGLVASKGLGALRTGFTNLSTDIGKLTPRLAELGARANVTAKAMGATAVITSQSNVAMSGAYGAAALASRGFAGMTTAASVAARAINGLAIAGSFLMGALGWVAAIGSIGYAIYNAFSKDNDAAIVAQAESINRLKVEYANLVGELDRFGKAKEKTALQEQIKYEKELTGTLEARIKTLQDTAEIYKSSGLDVPKVVEVELTINKKKLADTQKQIAAFQEQIDGIGSTAKEMMNAADAASVSGKDLAAQELRTENARKDAMSDWSESHDAKQSAYIAERLVLEAMVEQIKEQAKALNAVAQNAIQIEATFNGIMSAARQAGDAVFVKEGTAAEQYDKALNDVTASLAKLEQMKNNKSGADLVEREGKVLVAAEVARSKALVKMNETSAKLEEAQRALAVAGQPPKDKISDLTNNVTRLQEELNAVNAQREAGTLSNGRAQEKELDITNRLTAAKQAQYTAQKSIDTAARSAAKSAAKKTPEQTMVEQLDAYIGKQQNSTTASLASAAAYKAGSDAVQQFAIDQEVANEILKFTSKGLDVSAESQRQLTKAVVDANNAKQMEDVEKALFSIRKETEENKDQTLAVYAGEAALKAFNVQKQINQVLAGKSAEVIAAETAQVTAQANARQLAADALAKAQRGMALVDEYDKAIPLAREYTKDVEALNAAIASGAITAEKGAFYLAKLGQTYDENQSALTAWGQLTDKAIERVDASFADAWKNIDGGFDSFASSLKDGFKQLLAELAHEAITKPIVISFANSVLGTNKSGGFGEVWSKITGGDGVTGGITGGSSGAGGLLSNLFSGEKTPVAGTGPTTAQTAEQLLSGAKQLYSVSTSGFGKAVTSGFNTGEGFFGGVKGAFSNGSDYVSSLFKSGTASTGTNAASSAAGSWLGGSANSASGGAGVMLDNAGNVVYTSTASNVGAGAAGSTWGGAATGGGAIIGGIGGAIQGYQENGVKGAVVSGALAYGGGVAGTVLGTAAAAALSGTAMGAALGSILPGIGTIIGAALGAAFGSKIFAGAWETKGSGLQMGVVDGELDAKNFEYQKKKGGMFGSNKKRTNYYELEEAQATQLDDAFQATGDTVTDLYTKLGFKVNDNIIQGLNFAAVQIDTRDLTDEQITEAINKYFASIADSIVLAMNANLDTKGELDGYDFVELTAFVQNLISVDALLTNLNVGLYKMDIAGGHLAESLTAAAGGIDTLATQLNDYYNNFFTDQEKAADTLLAVNKEFKELGYTLPTTRAGFRNLVESMDITTEKGQEGFLALTKHATDAASAYTIMEQAANQAQENQAAYYEAFYSDGEKTADTLALVAAQFAVIGVALPNSRDGFRKMVEGIDRSTVSGKALYEAMMAMSSAADGVYDILDSAKDGAVAKAQAAQAAVGRAVEAQRNSVTEAYTAMTTSVNDMVDTIGTSISDLTSVSNSLANALKTLRNSMDVTGRVTYGQAQDVLQSALKTSRSGGSLADFKGLEDALDAVAANTTDTYSSLVDFLFAQGTTANVVEELSLTNGAQLTTAEKTLQSLKDQLKAAEDTYDLQMKAFDAQIDYAQAQMDALNGVDTTVLTVKDAVDRMNQAVVAAILASSNSAAANTSLNNATLVNSVYQAVLGRDADAAGQAAWTDALNNGLAYDKLPGAIAGSASGNGGTDGSAGSNYLNSSVEAAYQASLGRGADAAGLAFWTGQIASGAMSAAQVAAAIAGSVEAGGKKYATGGAFMGSGVVRTPTHFDESLMAESGPEAIMPLTNIGGVLGVRASISGGGSGSGRVDTMEGDIAEIKQALKSIAKWTSRTATNTDTLPRWDQTGIPEESL